ncbi:30S ribosomal protein S16 [Candidatus Curtissbacteria bacterium]|nr:30S ribosomal protein S16 [Candidatus Curtissbacteria bacterium]
MSVKIRLAVSGKKNQIAYRIVATDTRTKRDGKFLEILGFYNPKSNAVEKLRIEKDKIEAWRQKGAIITPAVTYLIEKGTLERPKKPRQGRGSPAEGEGAKVKKEESTPASGQASAQPQDETAPKEEKPQEARAEEPKPTKAAKPKEEPKP